MYSLFNFPCVFLSLSLSFIFFVFVCVCVCVLAVLCVAKLLVNLENVMLK